MEYKKIVVAGGGILGSQIAFQSAFCGFDVTILIRVEDPREDTEKKLSTLVDKYKNCISLMEKDGETSPEWARGIAGKGFNKEEALSKLDGILERIKIETDQKVALEDCDLLIESITEIFDVKSAFYQAVAPLLPEKTVIVTNSSTLLPSKLAKFTGRPNKYLSMHFANSIWKNNISEIMRHNGTEDKYFNEVIEFAGAINMIPLPVRQEKSGYLLNSLLVPFLMCAMDLYANGVSDPETIDKAWKYGTGAPHGPFEILDTVGLDTAKNILEQYLKVPGLFNGLFKKMMLPYNYKGSYEIINKYISEGKKGKAAGEGFFKYDK